MVQQESEKTIIEVGKKVLILEIKDFGSKEVDVEALLQVQINDIICDLITFPVIFNRIAFLKAEVDDLLRSVQFDLKVFEAQKYEEHKKKLIGAGEKATETSIEMAIIRDIQFQAKKKEALKVQKQADIIDGLYWSAKSKDQKLNAMSAKLKPEEFEKEILDGMINSVMITSRKNIFHNERSGAEKTR